MTTPIPPTLGDLGARQLANTTKTPAQLPIITPRWLTHLLQWNPVEAGVYRVNRVKNPADIRTACSVTDDGQLPNSFIDYDEKPREYWLRQVATKLNIHTRVSDL